MGRQARRTVLRWVLVPVLAMGGALAATAPARADVTAAPARTWGVGPATTTSASKGVPRVLAILPVGDRVFVGGTFSSVIDPSGVSYPVKNLAVFSATTGAADLTFAGGTNNTVTSLATDGSGALYVGGTFGTVNGATRKGLAALSTSTGALLPWSPSVVAPGQVDALAYSGGSVYAGGNFTGLTGGGAQSAPYAAKVGGVDGAVDAAWAAAPNDRVRALSVAAGGTPRLFLGGDFTAVSGRSSTNKLAAVSLLGGAVDTAFRAGPTNQGSYAPIFDVTSDGTSVYTATAGSGGACAALDIGSGALRWSAHSNGNMQGVRLFGGKLYCAGHYGGTGSFMGQTRNKLAAVDPATGALAAFAPSINSSQGPWALAADATRLYLGGDFSKVAGVAQPHFAMWLDSAATRVPQPPTGVVAAPGNAVVHLSWAVPSSDGGSGLQKYKVYRSTSPGGQNLSRSPLVTLSKTTRTFDDTAVVNGTTYYYVVQATNALGGSAASAEVSARPSGTVQVVPPGPPTSVAATSAPGYNHLQWNPPTADGGAPVTTYQVLRGTTPGGEGATPVAEVGTTAYDDSSDVVVGTTYYYVVRAVNAAGPGSASAEVSATLAPGTPGPPTLTATVVSGPSVQLQWTVPTTGGSPITKYTVLRDGVRVISLTATPSGPTTWTDVRPVSGVHEYQVRAANAYGNGQLSKKVTVTVP